MENDEKEDGENWKVDTEVWWEIIEHNRNSGGLEGREVREGELEGREVREGESEILINIAIPPPP